MAAKTNRVDMVNGPLWGKIFKFSITFMMTAILQEMYSAADIMVVGRYAGKAALAGVGTCSPIINLFLNLVTGIASGVTVVLGQALGENNDKITKSAHTSIAVAACGGAIISCVCLFFTKPLLALINVPSNVIKEASTYLRIMACGYVPSLVYNFGAGILRAKGDAKRPLYIVMASGLINVGLNLVFVCVFKMGAGGVALATVISKVFNGVTVLYILCNEQDQTRIFLKKIRIYKEPFLKILRFGLPSGIQNSVYSLSNMLVQSSINSFGAAAIAGSSASTSITNFYSVMGSSFYQSAIVFTSQNCGAKKFDRIKKTAFICVVYNLCAWALQSLITLCLGKVLIELYAPNDPLVIEMGLRKFQFVGYTYGILGLMHVLSGVLRGMGASIVNMFTSVIGVCGIRILWLLTVFKAIGTFESLFACYPVSWFGTAIMHACMVIYIYKKRKAEANEKLQI